MFGDEGHVGVPAIVLDVHNTGGDHLHQREAFAQAGDPLVGLFSGGGSHDQVIAAVTGLQMEIYLFCFLRICEYLAEDVGGKILLDKCLEGFLS